MSFFDKYCKAPAQPVITPITRQNVIDHFTKYIDNHCTNTTELVCVIKYSFPSEFIDRINPTDFWLNITSFLENDMQFKKIKQRYGTTGMLFDSDYKALPFRSFYAVIQKQASQHGEYFIQDYHATDFDISFMVFRIYKS